MIIWFDIYYGYDHDESTRRNSVGVGVGVAVAVLTCIISQFGRLLTQ